MLQVPTGPPSLALQKNVQLNSPLALIGSFIYILRDRFTLGNTDSDRWLWQDNKTSTGILIEAQFEKNTEARDQKPGIYVDRTSTVCGPASVGYRDQNQPRIIQERLEHFYCLVETDMVVDCVAGTKAESVTLGDICLQHLLCSRNILMTFFTLQDIGPLILGRTEPYQKDQMLFNSPITFRVRHEMRWATLPIAPILRELELKNTDNTVTTADKLSDIYISSLTGN